MTSTMKAIHFRKGGGDPSCLELQTIDRPKPGPQDVLVRIKAASVNPVDTKIRQGSFEASDITGFDAAGIVEDVGDNVANVRNGDEVYYAGHLGRPGAMAQYNLIDSRLLARKPKSISFTEAAAFPLVCLTAWEMLVDHFGLVPFATIDTMSSKVNENSILIINGAGGVGSIATQLARSVFNFKNVIVTASRKETIAHAKGMGATLVIDHHKELKPQLEDAGIKDCKYIMICHSTADYLLQATQIAAPWGKVGSIVETTDPLAFQGMDAFSKSLSFHWEFMFCRSVSGVAMEAQGRILKQCAKLIDSGTIKSLVSKTFPLSVENLITAHEMLESGKTIGKIVLDVGDDIQ